MEKSMFISLILSCGGALFLLGTASNAACPEGCDCQHTQQFLCTNRGLRAVPQPVPVQSAVDVREFGLAGNFIHNVSAFEFARYNNLMRLNLQFNRIQTIHPKAFEKLSKLEELYLGHNLISSIEPGTLQSLKKLTILYGNNNGIRKLTQESFNDLESVIKLRLDGNYIEILNESVFKSLINLMFLHLESNQLRHIHRNAFSCLIKLRFLDLSNNKQAELRDIPMFSQLRSLVTLLFSGNEIRHVGNHVFQNLRRLSKLSLSNNRISQMDNESLKGLSRVRELLIDGNELAEIPTTLLDPLERIERLDFSSNRISRVNPTAFQRLAHLKVLKLADNRLTSLSGGVFARNGALFSLDLSGNNWTCDCRMEKLKGWIMDAHSQGRLLPVFVRCHQPATLEGKFLDYVNNSQLLPQGNQSHNCDFETSAHPMESRGAGVLESQYLRKERERNGGERGGLGLQSDAGQRKGQQKRHQDRKKRRKAVSARIRPTSESIRSRIKAGRGFPSSSNEIAPSTTKTTATTIIHSSANRDLIGTQATVPSEHAPPVQFDPLLQDRSGHYETEVSVVTDACQFNRHAILNVSVNQVASHTATIWWSTIPLTRPPDNKELMFRVLFDRFGHTLRFPRYVYTQGTDRAVTLQELRPDSTYITCVESVVGGALCQVAPRDHCVGFVTLALSASAGTDFQLITVAALSVNAVLLLLVGVVWLGSALKRRIKSRKSSAHAHVRHMYSTRRPFRAAMATTCVSSEFSGFQSSRPLAEDGDLIQFPSDRFYDNSPTRREDDIMMPRFTD